MTLESSDPRESDAQDRPGMPAGAGHPKRATTAALALGTQPCPRCGHPMPDLKGGTATICAVCGFKDCCCY